MGCAQLGCDTGVKHHRPQGSHMQADTGHIPHQHQHHPNSPTTAGTIHGDGGCVHTPSPGAAQDSVIPPRPTLTPDPCDSSPWMMLLEPSSSQSDAPNQQI